MFWIPYIYGESKITVKGVGWRKSSNEKIPIIYDPKTGEIIKN
jgi:hypothetical protein